MNEPDMHNNIIGISNFWNGLNHPFSSPSFYLKGKIMEVVIKWKNNMIFQALFLKLYIFKVVVFFSRLVLIQLT